MAENGKTGPCPQLPVFPRLECYNFYLNYFLILTFQSISILSRCVPNMLNVKQEEGEDKKTKLGEALTEYFSEAGEFLRDSMLDFMKKWKEVLIVCAITIGIVKEKRIQ